MSKKKKELPFIEGVEITSVAAEGNAVARVAMPGTESIDGADNAMVLFVPYGAPGDIADIKVDRRKRRYAEGHIVNLIKPSELRVAPRCVHFGECGGCRWQHLDYSVQLDTKRQQVVDALERIGGFKGIDVAPTLGSDNIWHYRNKMEYTFCNKQWISWERIRAGETPGSEPAAGFHIPGAFDKVLDINQCELQDNLGDQLRLHIKAYAMEHGLSFYDVKERTGLLRTLMIRILTTGESMAVISFGEDAPELYMPLLDDIRNNFPQLSSLMYVVNTKCNDTIADLDINLHSGREYIEETMGELRFRIGPKSFYQTNSRQAQKLYEVARDMAELTGNELVYDLYTGTGTIANFVASRCKHVIGIEYVEDAIKDARINSEANGITNTEFYAGDMKDVLNDEFIAAHGCADVMIVDPPRAGMHQDVVDTILRAAPQRIVYVSCNPATQARDLTLLSTSYDIDKVQPVDMFPHTQHVENVVRLTLKAENCNN